MKTYTLTKIERITYKGAQEDQYTYESGTDKIVFHAHPTVAWSYVIPCCTVSARERNKLLDAWSAAGVSSFAKSIPFNDAIKTLVL